MSTTVDVQGNLLAFPGAPAPLALLPVRLETRYQRDAKGLWTLLVRVFPDDVHVDQSTPAKAVVTALPSAWIALGYRDAAPGTASPRGAVFAVRGNPIPGDLRIVPDAAGASLDATRTALVDPGFSWITDFATAEAQGMALRIPLGTTPNLDRLVVVGVKSVSASTAYAQMSRLVSMHQAGDGLGFLAAGTPTNVTSSPAPSAPPAASTGQVTNAAVAEKALALAAGTLAGLDGAGLGEPSHALAMATALWPATLGYFLAQLLAGIGDHSQLLAPADLDWLRGWFVSHVRPGGPLPTLRIGRQPYGLLPVTSIDLWPAQDTVDPRRAALVKVLRSLRTRAWSPAIASATRVGQNADPAGKVLGDLLVQQPHSYRFSARLLLGPQYVRNLFAVMNDYKPGVSTAWVPPADPAHATSTQSLVHFPLLPADTSEDDPHITVTYKRTATYSPTTLPWTSDPALFDSWFTAREQAAGGLFRAVLSDVGKSFAPRLFRATFHPYTFDPALPLTGTSILATLGNPASSLAAARDARPKSLLEAVLRHALMLELAAAARSTVPTAAGPGTGTWVEPELVGIGGTAPLDPVGVLTAKGYATLGAVPATLNPRLADLVAKLGWLAALPGDVLERLFMGVIDACSHRLDAWITSLATARLDDVAGRGVYLGSYGMVEGLSPKPAGQGTPPEHILAPSLQHASTAAILRSGWQSHLDEGSGGGSLAIDLTSARVRNALWVLDGVRNGQPIGALLGYRFERALFERSAQLASYVGALFRKLAPLRAPSAPTAQAADAVAAHDVTDGLALATLHRKYCDDGVALPFGTAASFEAYVFVDSIPEDYTAIVCKQTDVPSTSEYIFGLMSDGRLGFSWHTAADTSGNTVWGSAPSFNGVASTGKITTGKWTHVACVRDRTVVRFFIDGKPAGEALEPDASPFRPAGTNLRLGAQNVGRFKRFFKGRIREVRIWNVARTAGDMLRAAANQLAPAEAGLAGRWRFTEGKGPTVADSSPWGNDGTFHDTNASGNPSWVQVADDTKGWGPGSAMAFGGSQYVDLGAAPILALGPLPGITAGSPDAAALTAELDALADTVHALGDLTLAESVHQAVEGHPERASGTLDALSRGLLPPPELDVVRTPRAGASHTHRVILLLGGDPASPWAAAERAAHPATDPFAPAYAARAGAEPLLEAFAARVLGSPKRVAYHADYLDASGRVLKATDHTLDELNLSALDVVYLGDGELDRRLQLHLALNRPSGVPAGSTVRLALDRGASWTADRVSVPELLEVASALRRLFAGARPLTARDIKWPAPMDSAPDGLDAKDVKMRADALAQILTDLRNGKTGKPGLTAFTATSPSSDLDGLRAVLLGLAHCGFPAAVPRAYGSGADDAAVLYGQARAALAELDQRVHDRSGDADSADRLRGLLGGDFAVVPHFAPGGDTLTNLQAAFRTARKDWDMPALREQAWAWLQRAARVRDGAARLDDVLLYADALGYAGAPAGGPSLLRVGQLPANPNEVWVGQAGPSASLPGGRLSLVAHAAASLDPGAAAAGLVLDEWAEVVPRATQTAGVALRYDQPSAAPPQAILLAVLPSDQLLWNVAALEAVLLETLDLAKMRVLDPASLGAAPHLLPALAFPFNTGGETVSLDFAAK